MGLKHGMRLAAISGVNGVFSDSDIERVRDLALAALAKTQVASKTVTPSKRVTVRKKKPAAAQAAS
jgi:hypothetical protein